MASGATVPHRRTSAHGADRHRIAARGDAACDAS